jgi:hypothetical protein
MAPQRRQSFVVIDCPSKRVFRTLTQFNQTNFFNQDLKTHIDLIIHMTPYEIATTSEYKSWMKTFNSETKHVIMNNKIDSNPPPTVFTFDKIYDKLNKDHSHVFPALKYSVMDTNVVDFLNFPDTVTTASPSLKYIFRPQRLEGFVENRLRSKVESLLKTTRDKENAKNITSFETSNDFEVVFLGTGSRMSSILRNTSGILLNLR